MTPADPVSTRCRISVLLGSGSSCRRMLDALLPLLEREPASELLGVFIEEAELEAAAELPFVKELCRLTFSVREFRPDEARRQIDRRMREAGDYLKVIAEQTGAAHSLRNVRGLLPGLLHETVAASDITFFDPVRASTLSLSRAETHPGPARHRVIAVITGKTAPRVLRAAFELARRRPERLALLVTAAASQDPPRVERLLESALPPGRHLVDRLPDDTIFSVIEATRRLRAGCLVLPTDVDLVTEDSLRRLRAELTCPVVVVRGSN